jgi:hypothetical protein
MDARTKPAKARHGGRRARPAARPRKPAPARDTDQELLRQLATELRRNDENAERLRLVVKAALAQRCGPSLAEALSGAPDISGPEFDEVFEEIERFRHDPIMMQVRDVDL